MKHNELEYILDAITPELLEKLTVRDAELLRSFAELKELLENRYGFKIVVKNRY
ncbi:MAG TPA: hypothetical protein PK443_04810 [bacterium]|nr:hypothetical protein [bacterium]